MNYEIMTNVILLYNHDKEILLCKNKERNFYYLPGTKITLGKSVIASLSQYLSENYDLKLEKFYFLGIMENIYGNTHQLNLVFKIENGDKLQIKPKGEEIFEWVNLPISKQIDFQPEYLRDDLMHWLRGDKMFLTTEEKPFYS